MLTEEFDELTELFYTETRIWPPGRDRAAAMGGEDIEDVRHSAWEYWNRARRQLAAAKPEIEQAQAACAAMTPVLEELLALVRGECPSLLDEDSGGLARLYIAADAALAPNPGQPVLDKIARLERENTDLHQALFHVENGLSHPDSHVQLLIEAAAHGPVVEVSVGDGQGGGLQVKMA